MTSSKDYLDSVFEQLSELDDVENKEFLRKLIEEMYEDMSTENKNMIKEINDTQVPY